MDRSNHFSYHNYSSGPLKAIDGESNNEPKCREDEEERELYSNVKEMPLDRDVSLVQINNSLSIVKFRFE